MLTEGSVSQNYWLINRPTLGLYVSQVFALFWPSVDRYMHGWYVSQKLVECQLGISWVSIDNRPIWLSVECWLSNGRHVDWYPTKTWVTFGWYLTNSQLTLNQLSLDTSAVYQVSVGGYSAYTSAECQSIHVYQSKVLADTSYSKHDPTMLLVTFGLINQKGRAISTHKDQCSGKWMWEDKKITWSRLGVTRLEETAVGVLDKN